jgi:formylmethanofuran dehydrogenase subunit E
LVRREGNILHLDGVDILDGTPLLDIKPYTANFDRIETTRNGWQDEVDSVTAKERGRRGYCPADATEDKDLAETIRFHGHLCPGLAIGYRAAKEAMRRLGAGRADDEELIAIVENNTCAVDAVQVLTGCTFGKGNLFFRDHGKMVFAFAVRPSGRALRIAAKRRDLRKGEPSGDDRDARVRWLLSAPVDNLFDIRETTIALPSEAEIRKSIVCDRCGEEAMVSRARRRKGKTLCVPCAKGSQ